MFSRRRCRASRVFPSPPRARKGWQPCSKQQLQREVGGGEAWGEAELAGARQPGGGGRRLRAGGKRGGAEKARGLRGKESGRERRWG